ncbi:SDR family NAD(P)-dependent oxidoreductase [Microlunatus flavus]|uniref:Short-chain dehydrogenase n=1 Tax=Microlunatus flavus TaxID=1036181 RepID=A0A1H9AJ39_9ACTN|nr:SDR family oxidoreductase [Microlunatus flavus]SEP76491.1 hypothetical protein SAMN05421756_101621 [Microlunatus flavus]
MPTALVTGGTAGIGATFARHLAARGDDLVLVARDAGRLESTAADLRQTYGVEVEVLPADLADRTQVQRVVERLTDPARPVDTFVNNAGFGVHHRLTDPDPGPHERAVDVMLTAVIVLGGAAGRAMRERGRGAIVNVTSTAAFLTSGSYSAVKVAVLNWSESLANELRGTGVTVTALAPGWVRTEFHTRAAITTSSIPEALWLDADTLVDQCLADVARGKVLSVPSWRYRALVFAGRHAPRAAVMAASRALSSSRR